MKTNIIKTLSYAKAFNFPLKPEELHQRLIKTKVSQKKLINKTKQLGIKSQNNLYFLGSKDQVNSRLKNYKYQHKKEAKAQKIAKLFRLFPSIQAVVLTGAVAANNSKKLDDIDFLIITKKNSLWITRFFVNITLDILGLRRKVNSNQVTDKACLNLWLTTASLNLKKYRQNLYTAYEITLAKPIWDRNNTYKHFLSSNRWVKKYLPNQKIPSQPASKLKKSIFKNLDQVAYKAQVNYMKPKKTTESISRQYAFFHPRNTQSKIQQKFKKITKKYFKKYNLA